MRPLPCEALFDRLIALDHERQPPWGPLHAVVVACFFLQHPAHLDAPSGGRAVLRTILQRYLDGGVPAVDTFTTSARRLNSHRRSASAGLTAAQEQSLADVPACTEYSTTIGDVAVDGSFPACGYEERVRAWVRSTVKARTSSH